MKIVTVLTNDSRRPDRENTDMIVVHCAATAPSADIGAADIHRWHVERKWRGIGYHFVIRRSGLVERGERQERVGAHVAGYNYRSVAVCLVGGVSQKTGEAEANFTPEQYGALAVLLRELKTQYPDSRVCGHRDLSPDLNGDGIIQPREWMKQCPSFDAGAFWAAIE